MQADTDRHNDCECDVAVDVLLKDEDGVIVRFEHKGQEIYEDQRKYFLQNTVINFCPSHIHIPRHDVTLWLSKKLIESE